MSSGNGSLTRSRYNRGKRVAIVAACASVLSGTTLAMPAASFAAGAAGTVNVPDVDALPGAAKDDSARKTGVLELWGNIDPTPDKADPAPSTSEPTTAEPTTTAPTAAEPTATEPTSAQPTAAEPTSTAPTTAQPTTTAPTVAGPATTEPLAAPVVEKPLAAAPTVTGPTVTGPTVTGPKAEPTVTEVLAETLVETLIEPTITIKPAPSVPIYGAPSILRPFAAPSALKPASDVAGTEVAGTEVAGPSSNRVTPPSAVAEGPRGTDLDRASLVAGPAIEDGAVDAQAQRQLERSSLREADVLGLDKASPNESKGGLGLSAPLTDVGPRGVETVDLAARNAPDSSMGDWNLLPEALYAVVPLMLAGAAVAAHSRRNSRVAPLTLAGVQRGRHANLK